VFGECAGEFLVEIGVDCVFDDANWVRWLLVEIGPDFFKDVVSDVVVWMTGNNLCKWEGVGWEGG
jgi:hypothetical protein